MTAAWEGGSHLVDGEADRVHVLPVPAVPPTVLLHEGHQEAAGHFLVVWVIVLLQQGDLVLRVDPEGAWGWGGSVGCKRRTLTSGQEAAASRQRCIIAGERGGGDQSGCHGDRSLGWFRQPPAVLPRLHEPWNLMVFQKLGVSSLRASGVRLQISRRENCRRNSWKDILRKTGCDFQDVRASARRRRDHQGSGSMERPSNMSHGPGNINTTHHLSYGVICKKVYDRTTFFSN